MNLLRKCYDMTDFRIGHSYQHDKLEFENNIYRNFLATGGKLLYNIQQYTMGSADVP